MNNLDGILDYILYTLEVSLLPDKIHYQKFDSLGRVVQVLVDNDAKAETGKSLTGNDGEQVNGIDQVLAYKHNVKGEVIEMQRDNNVDGKYDYREVYTLDANGHWLAKEIDLTNDGKFDRKEVYTREADNGLVQTNFYNLVDGKEVLTKIEYYGLNANNQRTELKVDTLGDGSINAITTYEVDALGRIAKAYFDTDGDGVVDRVESYTRDDNGHILRNEISNAAGEIQTVRTYERNALGQAIKYEIDNGGDGIIYMRYVYTRDIYGNEQAYDRYTLNEITGELEWNNSVERVFNALNQMETAVYKGISSNGNYTVNYIYDEYGNKLSEISSGIIPRYDFAYNDDGTLHSRMRYNINGEMIEKVIYTEYDPAFGLSKTLEEYNAQDELVSIARYLRNENGNMIHTLIDYASDGIGGWETLTFGDRGANSSYNTTLEFTEEILAELGTSLNRIRMGNGAITQLTLNPEVVAKISEGGLRVQGAGDKNDILNLSGFTKADSSDMRNYDLYTASFDGEDLNLYVQANDSITVNIIG